jgi:hypothetical protein
MSATVPRLRRLAGCLLLAAFVAVALACAGAKPKNVGTVKVNEELVFPESKWVVVEAKDLGKVIKATNPDDAGEKKTEGRFILVRYKVTNTGRKEIELGWEDPKVVDDSREFRSLGDEQRDFLPKFAKTMSDEESTHIPAGMTREFHALYEVPADAKGLRLMAESFKERRGRPVNEGYVELGL